MNNDDLNYLLLAFGAEHFGKHENVSLFFWNDHDGSLKVRWLVAGKDGSFPWSQGAGDTLAKARADWIARRTERIETLEIQLANLKSQ